MAKPKRDPNQETAQTAEQAKIDERQEKVAKLYYTGGLTQREIAEQLQVDERTIRNDLASIKQRTPAHMTADFAQELIRDATFKLEHAINSASRQISIAQSPREKIAAAQAIGNLITQKVKLFQDLGIIDRAAMKIEVNENERLKTAFLHYLAQTGQTKAFMEKYGSYLEDSTKALPEAKRK